MAMPTIFTLSRWASGTSVVLAVVAMLVYPGGTVRDPTTRGYRLFQNFMSDLGMTVAHGGRPNDLGAYLFVGSLGLLALALVGCAVGFVMLHSSSPRQRHLVRAAGAAAALVGAGLLGAALTPADVSLALHLRFSSVAIGTAPVPLLLFALASARDDRFPKGVPAAWLALALLVGVLFAMRWGPGIATDRGLMIQVTVQKVVAVAVVAIVTYQTYQARRVGAG